MNFCPNCGTQIEEQKAGCPNCGFRPSEYSAEIEKKNIQEIKANDDIKPQQKEDKHTKLEKSEFNAPKVRGKHEKYDYYENRSYDKYNYNPYGYMNEEKSSDVEKELSLSAKVLLIVMVVFLNIFGAVAGIVIGVVFMRRNENAYKSFGKKLLVTSVIFFIVDILIWRIILATLRFIML